MINPEKAVFEARRFEAGKALLADPAYTLVPFFTDENSFHLYKGDTLYDVVEVDGGYTCTCPDFQKNLLPCKHIYAVQLTIKNREECQIASLEAHYRAIEAAETAEFGCDPYARY